MMEEVRYINVGKTKLEQMQQQCICSLEQPIVAVPLEFKIPGSNSFTSGYLMITCGSHYLFKGKPFGHISLAMKFNIFQVNVIHFTIEQLIFDFSDFVVMKFNQNTESQTNNQTSPSINSIQKSNDFSTSSNSLIFLKTRDFSYIIRASMYIQKSATYGITNIRMFRLDSSITINDIELKERPIDALKYRTVFFAHYYNSEEKSFLDVEYFKRWEKAPKYYLIINSSFQIGNFARAFGHSIAWERMIKIVGFHSFCPEQFSVFFDSLVSNSNLDSNSTISEVQFTEYMDENNLPEFSGRPLNCEQCSIKRYVFNKVLGKFVLSFFEKCNKIPIIEDLILSQVKIESIEFTQFCNCVLHNEAMKHNLKTLCIEQSNFQNFPMSDFGIMLGCLSKLETISICDFKFDAVRLFEAISTSKIPLRTIHINRARFTKSFENVTFPETLIYLDVSMCFFSDEAISSLLVCITKKPVKIPISISAMRITLKKSSYPAIGRIALNKCFPTIGEFNFSFNRIPAVGSRSLFAFLFTQKKLQNFSLNSVGTTDSIKLLKNIMMIILSLKITGFAISPASEKILTVFNKQLISQTENKETSESSSKMISEEDELLSFDFNVPATKSHSSNFADDLFSLDFTQAADINSNSNDNSNLNSNVASSENDLLSLIETKKSTKNKNAQKTPPKVSSVDPKTILLFVQALVQQNVSFLRRLILPNSKIGDEGIFALLKLIDISPNLNEIMIDGIQPDSVDAFLQLWGKIVCHRSIFACDFPKQDFEFLKEKIESENKSETIEALFEKIKKMKGISTTITRVKYLTELQNSGQTIINLDDIYEKCAVSKETEKVENENENKEEKSEVWKNSQINNDIDLLDFDEII